MRCSRDSPLKLRNRRTFTVLEELGQMVNSSPILAVAGGSLAGLPDPQEDVPLVVELATAVGV